jgi:hypothetical protein
MRPAPIIEILSRFECFDCEADEREVSDFDCGRFLAAGIGFESSGLRPRTVAWPQHHRNSVVFLGF